MNIKVVAWGLAWAGTEARPTKKGFFRKPETGNQKLATGRRRRPGVSDGGRRARHHLTPCRRLQVGSCSLERYHFVLGIGDQGHQIRAQG
jgi:hypothetical protein